MLDRYDYIDGIKNIARIPSKYNVHRRFRPEALGELQPNYQILKRRCNLFKKGIVSNDALCSDLL